MPAPHACLTWKRCYLNSWQRVLLLLHCTDNSQDEADSSYVALHYFGVRFFRRDVFIFIPFFILRNISVLFGGTTDEVSKSWLDNQNRLKVLESDLTDYRTYLQWYSSSAFMVTSGTISSKSNTHELKTGIPMALTMWTWTNHLIPLSFSFSSINDVINTYLTTLLWGIK